MIKNDFCATSNSIYYNTHSSSDKANYASQSSIVVNSWSNILKNNIIIIDDNTISDIPVKSIEPIK